MARQIANRREYKIRPGLKEASAALGVNYSHLRRVLVGQRQSRSLLKRYQELSLLQTAEPQSIPPMNSSSPRLPSNAPDNPNLPPVGPVDPADANLSPEWSEVVLGPLGMTVICIQLPRDSRAFESWEFFEQTGEALARAHLGDLDSIQTDPKFRVFLYAFSERLSEALNFLKAKLAERDLLAISAIGYMDTATKAWQTFHRGSEPPRA